MATDIRCSNCGRLLAKETDGVLDIKTTLKQEIKVTGQKIKFKCPWLYYTHEGRKLCGKTTEVELVQPVVC